MSDNEVLVDVTDGVMTITLNRPKAKNAVNLALAKGVAAAIDELESNAELRVAIIKGAEGTFCSGWSSCPGRYRPVSRWKWP